MAHFFTIICEYKGGTYTHQLHAESPVRAFAQWADHFAKEDILSAAEKMEFAGEVQYSLEEGNLAAMNGLQNVWYEGFSLGDHLLEVILVGMSEMPIPLVWEEQSVQAAG